MAKMFYSLEICLDAWCRSLINHILALFHLYFLLVYYKEAYCVKIQSVSFCFDLHLSNHNCHSFIINSIILKSLMLLQGVFYFSYDHQNFYDLLLRKNWSLMLPFLHHINTFQTSPMNQYYSFSFLLYPLIIFKLIKVVN